MLIKLTTNLGSTGEKEIVIKLKSLAPEFLAKFANDIAVIDGPNRHLILTKIRQYVEKKAGILLKSNEDAGKFVDLVKYATNPKPLMSRDLLKWEGEQILSPLERDIQIEIYDKIYSDIAKSLAPEALPKLAAPWKGYAFTFRAPPEMSVDCSVVYGKKYDSLDMMRLLGCISADEECGWLISIDPAANAATKAGVMIDSLYDQILYQDILKPGSVINAF